METCATCRYFKLRDETSDKGDCVRFPPQHIIAGFRVVELEPVDAPKIATPAGVAPRPLSMWLLDPEYASAYNGTNAGLTCGEWDNGETSEKESGDH